MPGTDLATIAEAGKAATTAETDAADTAALDAINAKWGGGGLTRTEAAKPLQVKAEKAEKPEKDAPAKEADAASDGEEEPEPEGRAVAPAAGEDPVSKAEKAEASAEDDSAITLLRRDEEDWSVIKKMSKQEIARRTAVLARRQSATDNLSRELGELRKFKVESEAKAKESAAKAPEQPDAKATEQPLAAFFDEEAVPVLESYVQDRIAKAIAEAKAKEPKAPEPQPDATGPLALRLALKDARRELEGRFQQLADPKEFRRAIEKLGTFSGEAFKDSDDPIVAALEEACLVLRFKETTEASRDEVRETHRRRNAGQPTTSARKTTPPALTKEQVDDAWFTERAPLYK